VLSGKDRDGLKVLHEVERKHITQRQAAGRMGISERWVRELVMRVRQKGDEGIVHGLRGRPSNLPPRVRLAWHSLVLWRSTKHFRSAKHPIMKSIEPGKNRSRYYIDEVT
jgi:DNA-binding Lrp family transcriptional regulator